MIAVCFLMDVGIALRKFRPGYDKKELMNVLYPAKNIHVVPVLSSIFPGTKTDFTLLLVNNESYRLSN